MSVAVLMSRGHMIVCARLHTETRSVCQSVRACVCLCDGESDLVDMLIKTPHRNTLYKPLIMCRLKQFINRGRQR